MQRHRGFTLLEIMMVLLIVAIMASAVGLAARPTDARELAISASQWQRSIQRMSAEAVAQSEVLALVPVRGGFAVKVWSRERWRDYAQVFDLPDLPGHVELRLLQSAPGKRIITFPSGEISPFHIELRSSSSESRFSLLSDGLQMTLEGE